MATHKILWPPPSRRRTNIQPFISVLKTPQGFPLIIKRNNDKTHLIIVRSEYYSHICGLDLIPLNWSTHNAVPQTNPTFRFFWVFGHSPTCRVTVRKSNDRSRFNFAQSESHKGTKPYLLTKVRFSFFSDFPVFLPKTTTIIVFRAPFWVFWKNHF